MDFLIFENVNNLTLDNIPQNYKESPCLFFFFNVKDKSSDSLFGEVGPILKKMKIGTINKETIACIFMKDNQMFPFSFNENCFSFSLSICYSFISPSLVGEMLFNNLHIKNADDFIEKAVGRLIVNVIKDFLDKNQIKDEKSLFANKYNIERLEEKLLDSLFSDFVSKLGISINKITVNKKNTDSGRPGWDVSDLVI